MSGKKHAIAPGRQNHDFQARRGLIMPLEPFAITNIPSAVELEETSLRIFFNAWVELLQVLDEEINAPLDERDYVNGQLLIDEEASAIRREEFARLSQPDLQLVLSLIQQSQEIALKAKLCGVSPFLLLLGSDVRSWAKRSGGDFSEFRTIDASDLMKVTDAIFPGAFSEKFMEQYEVVRGNRNKIQHLGAYKDKIDPKVLLDIMVRQYAELYPGRKWFRDRLKYQSHTRWSLFYDKRWNEKSAVFEELQTVFASLTNGQYKTLFGFKRGTRRYLCMKCRSDAQDDYLEGDLHTATLTDDGMSVYCHLCESEHAIDRRLCRDPECKSNVIGAEGQSYDICLLCGGENDLDQEDDTTRVYNN